LPLAAATCRFVERHGRAAGGHGDVDDLVHRGGLTVGQVDGEIERGALNQVVGVELVAEPVGEPPGPADVGGDVWDEADRSGGGAGVPRVARPIHVDVVDLPADGDGDRPGVGGVTRVHAGRRLRRPASLNNGLRAVRRQADHVAALVELDAVAVCLGGRCTRRGHQSGR